MKVNRLNLVTSGMLLLPLRLLTRLSKSTPSWMLTNFCHPNPVVRYIAVADLDMSGDTGSGGKILVSKIVWQKSHWMNGLLTKHIPTQTQDKHTQKKHA